MRNDLLMLLQEAQALAAVQQHLTAQAEERLERIKHLERENTYLRALLERHPAVQTYRQISEILK
jgi:predicted nuclease with TOPRIM domain